MAKAAGRNKVVQLGSGRRPPRGRCSSLRCKFTAGEPVIEQQLVSEVPLEVSVEKLRGFISDHHANVIELKETRVVLGRYLRIAGAAVPRSHRGRGSRWKSSSRKSANAGKAETIVRRHSFARTHQNAIRPEKTAERRQKLVDEHARQLLISLRAYLMAIDPRDTAASVLARAKELFLPRRAR